MRAAIKTPLGSLHPLQMSSLEIRALACRLLILFRKKRCKEFLKTCAFRPRSPFNIEFERLSSPYLSADDPREEEVAEERTNSYLVHSSWYLSQTESSLSLHPSEYYSVGLTQSPVIDALLNPNRKCLRGESTCFYQYDK